jgi:hypothetical protein
VDAVSKPCRQYCVPLVVDVVIELLS